MCRPEDRIDPPRRRVGVIGGGIAGLTSAWLVQHRLSADVVLFEQADCPGGQAPTVSVDLNRKGSINCYDGDKVSVDIGMDLQVLNPTAYPQLGELFEELGITTHPSELSIGCSVPLRNAQVGKEVFEWSSTQNLSTLVSECSHLTDHRGKDLLRDIGRFEHHATDFLRETDAGKHSEMSVDDFLVHFEYSHSFRDLYMLPMIAAIWSVPISQALMMPIAVLMRLMVNHDLHRIQNQPKSRTVVNTGRQYVDQVMRKLPDVRLNAQVTSIAVDDLDPPHGGGKVQVQLANGTTELFDDVILATPMDVSLHLLGEGATAEERDILRKIRYQTNRCVLHTDSSIMPSNCDMWASWNVKQFPRRSSDADSVADDASGLSTPICCSHWVNSLQDLGENIQEAEKSMKRGDHALLLLSMMLMAWKAQLFSHYQATKLILKGQRIYMIPHPSYGGIICSICLYSIDLVKHIIVFAVALLGLGVTYALKLLIQCGVVVFTACEVENVEETLHSAAPRTLQP